MSYAPRRVDQSPWRHRCGGFIVVCGTVSEFAFCARFGTCGKRWRTREEFLTDPDVGAPTRDLDPHDRAAVLP